MTAPTLAPAATTPSDRPGIPFARAVHLEARKVVDTRAGRWLLVTVGLLTAAALAVVLRFGDPAELSLSSLVPVTSSVLLLLYPVLGILTVTSEWSQRTALVTFTVEPRRGRVVLAKLLAAAAWAAAGLLVALALAAAAHGLAVLTRDVEASPALRPAPLAGLVLALLLAVAQGVAFGLVLRHPAVAISAYFMVPLAWTIVAGLIPGVERVRSWVDPTVSGAAVQAGTATASEWAHLAVASGLWVVLPLVVGTALLRRSEIA